MQTLSGALYAGLFFIVAVFLIALVSELVIDVVICLTAGLSLGALLHVLRLAAGKPSSTMVLLDAVMGAFAAFVIGILVTNIVYTLLLGGNLIGTAALYFDIALGLLGASAAFSVRSS